MERESGYHGAVASMQKIFRDAAGAVTHEGSARNDGMERI
jgi:hypothetical protein